MRYQLRISARSLCELLGQCGWRCAVLGWVALLGALAPASIVWGAGSLTIGPSVNQELKGWGLFPAAYDRQIPTYADGSKAWGDVGWLPEKGAAPAELHRTVCGLGFTIARVGISPSTGRPDGSLDPERLQDLKDHLALLRAEGVTNYICTLWSPPAHMKLPDRVRYGKYQGRVQHLDPAFAGESKPELARYIAQVLQHVVASGFPPPLAVSLQNEPDVAQTYDSCVYTETEEQRAVYCGAVKQLRAALDAQGLGSTAILATESSGSGGLPGLLGEVSTNGFAGLCRDPALAAAIGGFAFHQYYTSDRLRTFDAAMAAYPGRDRWMTEVCQDATPLRSEERAKSSDEQLNVAIDMTRRLAADLVDYRVNYWFFWRGWHPTGTNAFPAQDLVYGENPPRLMKLGQVLRRVWTTVRPGWRVMRVTAAGTNLRCDNQRIIQGYEPNGNMMSLGLDVVAFESPDGRRSCVVLANSSAGARALSRMSGLPGARARLFVTDPTRVDAPESVRMFRGGNLEQSLTLPPWSISICLTEP